MELINPHLVVNYNINDDYYCKKIIAELKERLHYLLNEVVLDDTLIRFRKDWLDFVVEYDKTKPINRQSILNTLNKILHREFNGAIEMRTPPKEFEISGIVEVSIKILDPYKVLYNFYYERFKKVILDFLNEGIREAASKTNNEYFKFDVDYECSRVRNYPSEYFEKLLHDLVKSSYNYKLVISPDLECRTYVISWGAEKLQENKEESPLPFDCQAEPKKLSFMDRLRDYAKRLVEHQRKNYD